MVNVQAQPAMLERFNTAVTVWPKAPALWFGGRTFSYRQLQWHVQRAADALRYLGLGSGMTLALVVPSGPALAIYAIAAQACGAAIVVLDPDQDGELLAQRLKACDVRRIVILDHPSLLIRAQDLLAAKHVERVLVVSRAAHLPLARAAARRLVSLLRDDRPSAGSASGLIYERDALREARRTLREAKAKPETPGGVAPVNTAAIAIRLVTPMADGHQVASLTHGMIAAAVEQLSGALPPLAAGQERILVLVPLSSAVAMTASLGLAISAASQLICSPDVTPKALLRTLRRTRPTFIVGNSAQLAAMAANPALGPAHFAELKLILNLDWDKPPGLQEALARLSRAPIVSCYAVEEVGALIAVGSSAQPHSPLSVGRALPNTRLVVRDLGDLTRAVGPGERGELCVSGPQVVTPQSLLQVQSGAGANDGMAAFIDDHLRTGDLGAVDAAGQVFVIDRIADMIVAAGYLIYPRRIEAALREHPGVGEVCVIGIGDKRRGQAPKAFVVLKRGIAVTERDLRLHLATRVSKIEMPSDIDFCMTLPRDAAGAVCKATLRTQVR